MDEQFQLFDTTLRDGAQREGISFSVEDKLAICRLLDEYGVGYIEGGWPGALPKDTEFFARAADELKLRNAVLVAFGSTRKAGVQVQDDPQVAALLESGAPVITLVAKSDIRHVEKALRTTADENLAMVSQTVAYLREQGRRVFVDCEHFFDGYKHDRDYAISVARAALESGAEVAVMCDTNGGMLPMGIHEVVTDVRASVDGNLGIHCQDDTGCAIANTVTAVQAGVIQAQCTANGYGERTGNADLFVVTANLELKLGMQVLPPGHLRESQRIAHAIAEIANIAPDTHQPYVGVSSFAHKAGLHASALRVDYDLYNHEDAASVGNDMRVLVTEMAGRASVELKGKELGYELADDQQVLGNVVDRVKELEAQGWTFEAADASFELLIMEERDPELAQPFTVESWRTIVEQRIDGEVVSEATVKVRAGDRRIVAVGEGNGPVNALDNALRAALMEFYPQLASMDLVDYKVRILEGVRGTDAVTRTLVGSSDGSRRWDTVGVHENVIAASWMALEDAVRFGLLAVLPSS